MRTIYLPPWAAPLNRVIAAFIDHGGGSTRVHYQKLGGDEKLEVSMTLDRKAVESIARELGIAH
jgi:hypothetical protein